jgi:hypothetical protein
MSRDVGEVVGVNAAGNLLPLVQGLDIDRPDPNVAFAEIGGGMATDETAAMSDQNCLLTTIHGLATSSRIFPPAPRYPAATV